MRSEPMEEAPKRKPQRIVRQGPLDGLYGLYVMCVCVFFFPDPHARLFATTDSGLLGV